MWGSVDVSLAHNQPGDVERVVESLANTATILAGAPGVRCRWWDLALVFGQSDPSMVRYLFPFKRGKGGGGRCVLCAWSRYFVLFCAVLI